MKSTVEINSPHDSIAEVLRPSLDTDDTVSYTIEENDKLRITVETDSLGPLRGATDTVFRLAMLGNKILQR